MVLVDLSPVSYASLMMHLAMTKSRVADPDLVRHMILNSLRSYRRMFRDDFGELVICCDSYSWRYDAFPHYKCRRATTKSASDYDWEELDRIMKMVRDEIKENMPYKVLQVLKAEADDIIGTICQEHGTILGGDPILIISGDKDFAQLHRFGNVRQYGPVQQKDYITVANPEAHLREMIIRGDPGDDVPNIFSDDDTFANPSKRQTPISKKNMEMWINANPSSFCTTDKLRRNYARNKLLVDLSQTPTDLQKGILDVYETTTPAKRSKVFSYFVSKKLRTLTESIGDF